MKIRDCAEVVQQMVDDDKPRDDLYGKIDKAIKCDFTPSSAVTKLPWVKERHYGMTNIADAIRDHAQTMDSAISCLKPEE